MRKRAKCAPSKPEPKVDTFDFLAGFFSERLDRKSAQEACTADSLRRIFAPTTPHAIELPELPRNACVSRTCGLQWLARSPGSWNATKDTCNAGIRLGGGRKSRGPLAQPAWHGGA